MLTGVLWKYVSGGLLIAVLLFAGLYSMERRHSRKQGERIAGLVSELNRISNERDEQRKETERRIREAQENVRTVERVVTKLESRPISGEKCETPDLEEWRGVL